MLWAPGHGSLPLSPLLVCRKQASASTEPSLSFKGQTAANQEVEVRDAALEQGLVPTQGIHITIPLSLSAELKPPTNENHQLQMKVTSLQRTGHSWDNPRIIEL